MSCSWVLTSHAVNLCYGVNNTLLVLARVILLTYIMLLISCVMVLPNVMLLCFGVSPSVVSLTNILVSGSGFQVRWGTCLARHIILSNCVARNQTFTKLLVPQIPFNSLSLSWYIDRIGMQSNFHLLRIHFNFRPQIRVYSGEEIQFSGCRTRINEIPAWGARSLERETVEKTLHISKHISGTRQWLWVPCSDLEDKSTGFDHSFDLEACTRIMETVSSHLTYIW